MSDLNDPNFQAPWSELLFDLLNTGIGSFKTELSVPCKMHFAVSGGKCLTAEQYQIVCRNELLAIVERLESMASRLRRQMQDIGRGEERRDLVGAILEASRAGALSPQVSGIRGESSRPRGHPDD